MVTCFLDACFLDACNTQNSVGKILKPLHFKGIALPPDLTSGKRAMGTTTSKLQKQVFLVFPDVEEYASALAALDTPQKREDFRDCFKLPNGPARAKAYVNRVLHPSLIAARPAPLHGEHLVI